MAALHLSSILCILACVSLIATSGQSVMSPSSSCTVECCEGCVINTYSTLSKSDRVCTGKYKPVRYYTDCGFWGLGSCTRYRAGYYDDCITNTQYYVGVHAVCKPGCQCVDQPN